MTTTTSESPDGGVTMNDSDVDELGPVDYLVVEFRPIERTSPANGGGVDRSRRARRRPRARPAVPEEDDDGSVEGFESHDFGDDKLAELRGAETELALLLAEEDVEAIGAALEPEASRPCWSGERLGGAVWFVCAALGWSVGGQRPDPDPGASGRDRGA